MRDTPKLTPATPENSAELFASDQLQILTEAVQDLSFTRSIGEIMAIVRIAARKLAGSDGATFVLREGDQCYYADEDAISPLWKGSRFPMSACISGWVMLHKEPAVIPDIYQDPRIPADAYRPTFVKSLTMVPIRRKDPIGAIGNYWSKPHASTPGQIKLLQALADSTSIAIENIQISQRIESKMKEKMKDLENFSHSASHDLKGPLSRISSFARLLNEDHAAKLDETGKMCLERIYQTTDQMLSTVDTLLQMTRIEQKHLNLAEVDVSGMVHSIFDGIRLENPGHSVSLLIEPHLSALADEAVLRLAIENLCRNAWKFSSKNPSPKIEFGMKKNLNGKDVYFLKDNGIGFDMNEAGKVFQTFKRLHSDQEFPGTGIGLATCQKAIERHGGRIWAESKPGQGATFLFTLS